MAYGPEPYMDSNCSPTRSVQLEEVQQAWPECSHEFVVLRWRRVNATWRLLQLHEKYKRTKTWCGRNRVHDSFMRQRGQLKRLYWESLRRFGY